MRIIESTSCNTHSLLATCNQFSYMYASGIPQHLTGLLQNIVEMTVVAHHQLKVTSMSSKATVGLRGSVLSITYCANTG